MKICFFSYAFPGSHDTTHYAFVKQLVDAIASLGNECHVVTPYNILHYKKFSRKKETYYVGNGSVCVYRPYFLSFSTIKCMAWISKYSRRRALKRAESLLPLDIEVVYGHFWNSGYEGYHYAKKNSLPLFIASGESDINRMFQRPPDIREYSQYVKGVVCVSSKNRDESVKLGLTTIDRCGVFPNAVNSNLFHKYNKEECRLMLGFPLNEFIVAFVGWFNERKGVLRVAEAIGRVKDVRSFFIGKGELNPQCNGILFKGVVHHDDVPLYLGAADCFVLPTRAEGSCNAIVEAMSCGLPIISSNLPFNWDVLDKSNSIMIDPNNVEDLTKAICTLRDEPEKCKMLAEGALKKATELTIDKRADAILSFIKSKL